MSDITAELQFSMALVAADYVAASGIVLKDHAVCARAVHARTYQLLQRCTDSFANSFANASTTVLVAGVTRRRRWLDYALGCLAKRSPGELAAYREPGAACIATRLVRRIILLATSYLGYFKCLACLLISNHSERRQVRAYPCVGST